MEYSESPAPSEKGSREKFFNELKNNTEYFESQNEFSKRAKELRGGVSQSGVCLFIPVIRNEKGETIGHLKPTILVDRSYYSIKFGGDFSSMLPYDLEHEYWEIYYAAKKGFNPDVLDIKSGANRHFGLAHKLAVRRALEKAHREGVLNVYLNWADIQMDYLSNKGYEGAAAEKNFYHTQAGKIKG